MLKKAQLSHYYIRYHDRKPERTMLGSIDIFIFPLEKPVYITALNLLVLNLQL